MKKVIMALAALMIMAIGCKQSDERGYIGPSDIVVADGVMTPEVLLSLGRLSDPQLSPDGSKILYGVSYTDIDQNRSCRNLFLCNTDGSGKVQLTRDGKSVSNARWAADGKSIFFLQGGQLWQAPLIGLQPAKLTSEATASEAASEASAATSTAASSAASSPARLGKRVKLSEVPAGIAEFKLAPDQKSLIYISSIKNAKVQQAADIDPRLDKAQAYVTEDLMYRHWDHWVTETPRSYVAALGGAPITPENSVDILGSEPYELPTEPFGGAEQLDWAPDSRHIVYSCRKHMGKEYAFSTNCGIYVYDVLTGATVTVKGDGGYDTDPVWAPDGKHIAWVSMPRDGYEADQQRLFVVDVDLQEADEQSFGMSFSNVRNMAPDFRYDVSSPFWNPMGKGVVFSSLAEGVGKVFCAKLDGTVKQVSKDEWAYDFHPSQMTVADGRRTIYGTYTSLNFPAELVQISVSKEGEASFRQIGDENGHILAQLGEPTAESVMVKTVDGKDMQCWVLYPPRFDESKQYPAIEIALGGPQGTNSQAWSYRWCYRLMAEQGYVVILPNRRGTTAFGQEWKEQISGDYSGLNMQDYLCAGRYIKSKPYVGKLACAGASYGGFSAYMLEGLHEDLYDCFIAHAGIFDEKGLWYTTEEMWFANWDNGGLSEYAYTEGQQGPAGDGITFGGMQQAGAPYSSTPKALHHYANAPETKTTAWHTPILCIHGMLDFRIPYTQGMAAFNAAQMMGVPSKLVIFPEENHWILQPQNSLLWHREVYDWLERWIKE